MKTPEEIKKGLELCDGKFLPFYCAECPYNKEKGHCDRDNKEKIKRDAIALINRLEGNIHDNTGTGGGVSMEKTITINLNDIVKVKLTDVGKDIYYHQNDELNEEIRQHGGRTVEARMPKVDEDGYTSFQLHDLMTLYGPHIAVWKKLPFEINILYEVQSNDT